MSKIIRIALEGPDGTGKSKLANAMSCAMTSWSHMRSRLWTHFRPTTLDPWEAALSYAAQRRRLVSWNLTPIDDEIIILDRWTQSNLTAPCEQANTLALLEEQMLPRLDGIVLLDSSDEKLDCALAARGAPGEINDDRFRLRKAYREIYPKYGCCAWWPQNTLIIDTSQRDEKSIEAEVRRWIEAIITERSIA